MLLLALSVAPGHRLDRDIVLDTLRPEKLPANTEGSLKALLTSIRTALRCDPGDPTIVQSQGESLVLNPHLVLDLDVDAFRRAATQALASGDVQSLRAAAAVYAGPLLPDLRYDDWVIHWRDELARLQERVLAALAAVEARNNPAGAEAALRALLAADPTKEHPTRSLMRLLAESGRRAEAVHLYQSLTQSLREELGVEPAPKRRRSMPGCCKRRRPQTCLHLSPASWVASENWTR